MNFQVSCAVYRKSFTCAVKCSTYLQLVWVWEAQWKRTSYPFVHRMRRGSDNEGESGLGSSQTPLIKVLDPLGSDSHPGGPSPALFLPGFLPGSKPCVHGSFISAQPGCAGKHGSGADPISGPWDGMWRLQQTEMCRWCGEAALSGWLHR